MSYRASGEGFMILRLPSRNAFLCQYLCAQEPCGDRAGRENPYHDPFIWVQAALKNAGFDKAERGAAAVDGFVKIELSICNCYDAGIVLALLDALSAHTTEGSLAFFGEDGDRWRYQFVAGRWVRQKGILQYISTAGY